MTRYANISRPSNGTQRPTEEGGTTSPAERSSLGLTGKRAIAIVFSSYPSDPRPRRAAEALAKEGMDVEVICLRETEEEAARESFNGVEITRVRLKRRRAGKFTYFAQYGAFILSCGAILASRAFRRRYDLVHVHNMPDVLVFSALVPKILGARVILDLHDPMPELMMSIFGMQRKSFAVKLLETLEKWSLGFADAVLTVNEACRKIFSARSCPIEKISVVMNSPDENIFQHRIAVQQSLVNRDAARPFVMMYHGSIVERHGLDLAVKALAKVRESIPKAELRIYGRSTPFLEKVMESVQRLMLNDAVRYLGPKKLEEIVEAIKDCDVGIIPNRRSIFTELNTPTRIFEYLSQGKPAIAPCSPGILDYFSQAELGLFELGDADDLVAKIQYVFSHPEEIAQMVERGQEVYRAHMWSQERERFLHVVNGLVTPARNEAALDERSPVLAGEDPQ